MLKTTGRMEIYQGSIFSKVFQFREDDEATNNSLVGATVKMFFSKTDGTTLEKTLTVATPAELGNATLSLSSAETALLLEGCEQSVKVTITIGGNVEILVLENILDIITP